jgi:hypothetical protein
MGRSAGEGSADLARPVHRLSAALVVVTVAGAAATFFSLAIWSTVAILTRTDVKALGERFVPKLPVRGIAIYSLVVATLNFLAWIAESAQPGGVSTHSGRNREITP